MAYQRLQVTRALEVHKTNSGIDIPDPDFAGITGTNATSTTNKLTVAGADTFTAKTVQTGYIVENVSTGAYARVAAIDSGTQLTLSGDIFSTAGSIYQIYSQSTRGCILYVGAGGTMRVITAAGDDVTYQGVPVGVFLPIQVIRVVETGTSASGFIAHW
jgi:hypothetical protein|tara:strand:- start:34 stop:510 length:477 start_codon:yes stop_codon:yes gene_type:complete